MSIYNVTLKVIKSDWYCEGHDIQGQTQTRADTDNFQGETLPSMNYFFAFGLVGLIANLCLYPSHCFV